MKKILGVFIKSLIVIFVLFLLLEATVFFAVKYGLTDVGGEIDGNSEIYNDSAKNKSEVEELATSTEEETEISSSTPFFTLPETGSIYGPNAKENWCKVNVAIRYNQLTAKPIFETYKKTRSEVLLNDMLLAMKLRLANRQEFETDLNNCKQETMEILPETLEDDFKDTSTTSIYSWQNAESWSIIKEAIVKDKQIIEEAAKQAGVQPRLLVSVAIVEQLRLYHTQRELFEKVFKPLKILANANKMAWGIMSIKEKMAIETEEHLTDKNSPYYIGTSTEKLLDYGEGEEKDKVRYDRLTDEKNHYYSYLYGALIIKQFQLQWEKAGYPIKYRPEIVATLFNIGFNNSKPKANPQVGGSTMEIDGEKYFFGSLAYEFYYSGVMMDEFPFE